MRAYTQLSRMLSITSPIGGDTLLLAGFEFSEYVSNLFHGTAEVLSDDANLTPDKLVGKPITITIKHRIPVIFNAYVQSMTIYDRPDTELTAYQLELIPWFGLLQHSQNNRIFQNKNAQKIITEIFQQYGFNDFEFMTNTGGNTREYCVQYGESDFQFVSRLLEEEGFIYYFIHEAGKHTLRITDKINVYPNILEKGLEYSHGSDVKERITNWQRLYQFRKGEWVLSDYDFKSPTSSQLKKAIGDNKYYQNKKYEHYEYPGYYDVTLKQELVKYRLEAEEAQRNTVLGGSDISRMRAGHRFKMAKHAHVREQGEYILLSVHHHAVDESYLNNQDNAFEYHNSFTCLPDTIQYRPRYIHRRPIMPGPQSAMVVGPEGEEIYIDDLRRIKVQFIWDRLGGKNENSSCFIRVMQPWAGHGWGTSFIPRIGQEVIVNFLNGDPDRPIVIGAMYNGTHKIPFESKTQSGIRTNSSKDGSSDNFNELRFDDAIGAEQIYIHAEKNQDNVVENDETTEVGHDRTENVGNNETITIGNDRSEDVGNNETINIGNNRDETVGKNQSISIGENHTESIGANMTITIDKNLRETIKVDYNEEVKANKKSLITKDLTEQIDANHRETVKKDYSLKAKKIQVVADDEISLKTGKATIVMKKNGDITIQGNKITVKGSSDVILKGSKIKEN